jgi:hypothetical protein
LQLFSERELHKLDNKYSLSVTCTWPGWCQCRHLLSACSAPDSMHMASVFCLQMYMSEVSYCQLSCRLNCSSGNLQFKYKLSEVRKPLFFLCLNSLQLQVSNGQPNGQSIQLFSLQIELSLTPLLVDWIILDSSVGCCNKSPEDSSWTRSICIQVYSPLKTQRDQSSCISHQSSRQGQRHMCLHVNPIPPCS